MTDSLEDEIDAFVAEAEELVARATNSRLELVDYLVEARAPGDPYIEYAKRDVEILAELYAKTGKPHRVKRGGCMGCGGRVSAKPHSCPFNERVAGDYVSTCNCCSECTKSCRLRAEEGPPR